MVSDSGVVVHKGQELGVGGGRDPGSDPQPEAQATKWAMEPCDLFHFSLLLPRDVVRCVPVGSGVLSPCSCARRITELFTLRHPKYGAAVAGVRQAAGKEMTPFEALALGLGQMFCVVEISFLQVLFTL